MGCCGRDRDLDKPLANEAKFDYVDLRTFRSRSCINYTAYGYLYLSVFISLASYCADIYTMITILALNTWSKTLIAANSSLISYQVARIIFTSCICFSLALLGFEWFRAIRVIKRNGVAEAYMNAIALRWSSVRGGPGKDDTGWRRFLLFARLTSERGKLDYIALFTYFAFKGWARTLFAEGPRVVVNALTIISVANLQKGIEDHNGALSILQKFWANVETLYDNDKLSAITLGTMAFTTLLWIIDMIKLLLAANFYICVLWHVMNGASLRTYCKVRIDKRLAEIVKKKYQKELAREREKHRTLLAREPAIPNLNAPPGDKKGFSEPEVLIVDGDDRVKLLDNASTMSGHTWSPPPMSREPTLPNFSDLESQRGTPSPAPAYKMRVPTFASYAAQEQYQGRSPSPGMYQMQHLPPQGSGRSDFGDDRFAHDPSRLGPRAGTAPPQQNYPPSRNLTNPPPQRSQTDPAWMGGPPPRAYTPSSGPGRGPPSRQVPPMPQGPPNRGPGGYGAPPPAGPGRGGYGGGDVQYPPRSRTAAPAPPRLQNPNNYSSNDNFQQQFYGHNPQQQYTESPQEYFRPEPAERAQTAAPGAGPRGPPRNVPQQMNSREEFRPKQIQRSNTEPQNTQDPHTEPVKRIGTVPQERQKKPAVYGDWAGGGGPRDGFV